MSRIKSWGITIVFFGILLACTTSEARNINVTEAGASFNHPSGVVLDRAGHIYVGDTFNSFIRKVTPAGVVSTLTDNSNGGGTAARFDQPVGVATDNAGNIYVADVGNHSIRKITPSGVVTTLAGSADGAFDQPIGVATDSLGNVFVADCGNHSISKITPTGVVQTLISTRKMVDRVGGPEAANSFGFGFPIGIATDSKGNVYVADNFKNTILKITPEGILTTMAGSVGGGWAC